MFPDSYPGPIYLAAWVQIGGVSFQAIIVDADVQTQTAQVIRLGTLFEQSVPFTALSSVALKEGDRVVKAFGRPTIKTTPEWVRFAIV